jgi:hypothetical protein
MKNLGWKMITGTLIAALGYAGKAFFPEFGVAWDAIIAIGIALGGIGGRLAIRDVVTAVKNGK